MELRANELIRIRRTKLSSIKQLRDGAGKQDEVTVCPKCSSAIATKNLHKNYFVCPDCGCYFSMTAEERIFFLADEDSFHELSAGIRTKDPLGFPGYKQKVHEISKQTGMDDAILTGTIRINGIKTAIGVLDSRFLMGSMGTVVGEKIALLAEYAGRKKLPLLIFSASGGARMQEGLFSLMQMVKTSAAVERFRGNGGLFISCLTNPTTGGVSASYANLGDIIMAEPGALICFAGPRVIEQTIGQTLPEGFQKAEFLEEHGMLDMVVERREMKAVLGRILKMHGR